MTRMILRSSPTSPFGRKIKLSLAVLGLADDVECIVADTGNPEDSLRLQNPLGKIPVLLLADGTALYDSPVIVEYLDHIAGGGRLLPADPDRRFRVLTRQALADGIMEAAVLRRYETLMHEPGLASSKWDAHQAGKIDRALAALEASPPDETTTTIAEIALACALGYLDFRFPGSWRDAHPRLADWFGRFAWRCPGFAATEPK